MWIPLLRVGRVRTDRKVAVGSRLDHGSAAGRHDAPRAGGAADQAALDRAYEAYRDDDDLDAYVYEPPAQDLDLSAGYLRNLRNLADRPNRFPAGERFDYVDAGYRLLAVIAERVSDVPLRTNVFHLGVRGSGDAGIYSTAADASAFWSAMFDGRIVSQESVARVVEPHSEVPDMPLPTMDGMGFFRRPTGPIGSLGGLDVGVSFYSQYDPKPKPWPRCCPTTPTGPCRSSRSSALSLAGQ